MRRYYIPPYGKWEMDYIPFQKKFVNGTNSDIQSNHKEFRKKINY